MVAGLNKYQGWGMGVAGEVLGGEANDHSGPESEADASESLPSGDIECSTACFAEAEGLWQNVHRWKDGTSHEEA